VRAGDDAPPAESAGGAVAARAADHDRAAGRIGGPRLTATASRWLAYGLWAVVGLALLLGVANCAQWPAAVTVPRDTAVAGRPAAPPGGCAELVVAAWLSGDADQLPRHAAPRSPDQVERRAVRTHTVAVTAGSSPHSWGYLVGAQVQEREGDDGQWRDAGLHYFAVTMAESDAGCQGWRPVASPMQVAAPRLEPDARAPYPVSLAASGTALSDTLEAFFGGMLTGTGGMDRYVAPGVTIPPVVPPPYAEVGMVELRAGAGAPLRRGDEVPPDGTTVRLLVTVTADRAALPLTYPVTVAVRGGRWEVVAVDPLVGATPAETTLRASADPPATHASVGPPATPEPSAPPASPVPAVPSAP
jgi:hypothetical protein